jgi:hypothetical protein
MTTHFVPDDPDEDRRQNRGEDVTNWCRNCRQPFMAHTNGVCPPNPEEWGESMELGRVER